MRTMTSQDYAATMQNAADATNARLTAACDHYEKTAPTVAAYLNDLYVRMNEDASSVRLSELHFLAVLVEEGAWMHPNYAANAVYHLMSRLGMDTTGHAGF